jgi:hypothetical protein
MVLYPSSNMLAVLCAVLCRIYCYIVWSFSVVGMVIVEPFTILLHDNAINGGVGHPGLLHLSISIYI